MSKNFLILIIICFLFSPIKIFGQIQDYDITLKISPEQPKVNQKIKANISSFVLNTKDSYYVWKLDDETKLTGIGRDVFEFTLGENELTQTELSVSITTKEGGNFEKRFTFNSSDIDLLWEATNSYVPPFYRGKALFGKEGEIKVSAIPFIYNQGSRINPNTLSYSWSKDGNSQITNSGFGKSSFLYKNSFLDTSNNISVSVSDISKQYQVKDSLTVIPNTPKISFYSLDSSGIDLRNAITNNSFIPKEGKDIFVAPYFFSPKNIDSNDLSIEWFVSGKPVLNTASKNIISVVPQEGEGGSANIKVIISNLRTLFQDLEKTVKVNF